MSSHTQPSDRGAAFTGLICGAIAIFVMVYTIVHLTEKHYENAKAEGAPAAATAGK